MIRNWGIRGVGKLLLKQQQQQQYKQRAVRSISSCYAKKSFSNHVLRVSATVGSTNNNIPVTTRRSMASFTGGQKREESVMAAKTSDDSSPGAQAQVVIDATTTGSDPAIEELSAQDSSFIETPGKPYKVLIANRGEIAKRIIETCQRYNFPTVAIYSTADSKAPHVSLADEAICVGPASSSDSYLDVPKVLKAIEVSGADAVHPGYGFLSENAEFAKTILDAGKIWLGPPISAVHEMGDKIESKILAKNAGVNTIPGYKGVIESIEHAIQIVNQGIPGEADSQVGYPILLKAAAGGGGKGMRICYNDQDLIEAFPLAKAEAKNFFKDDRLLIEKFIENPHHIEFQVLCCSVYDKQKKKPKAISGLNPFPILLDKTKYKKKTQVVVFPERECSIQRRNQKIIEETPSTLLTPKTRQKMMEQVTKLCQTVGYESAGTVEFLVDEEQNFYFLEMNTRLQVEHPVSEAVCGVDLVKGMLWVGAGWGLPDEFLPDEEEDDNDEEAVEENKETETTESKELPPIVLPWKGHAIEARIYAEDPTKGFVPSTGTLLPYIEPSSYLKSSVESLQDGLAIDDTRQYIRIDSGVRQGSIVSPFYDPMLSKLIAYSSKSRIDSIDLLSRALDEYVIEGVQHNASLVNDVLRHDDFRNGNTPTSYIPNHYEDGIFPSNALEFMLSVKEREELAVSAASIYKKIINHNNNNKTTFIVKLGGMFHDEETYQITNMDDIHNDNTPVTIQRLISTTNAEEEEKTLSTAAPEERTVVLDTPIAYEPSTYLANISLDGVPRSIQVLKNNEHVNSSIDIGEFIVQMYGAKIKVFIFDDEREYELSKYMKPPQNLSNGGNNNNTIPSPMPGTLVSFSVEEGDTVEMGQDLCIVEAMKMQNVIKAPRAGTIEKLNVDVGTSLMADQIILEFVKEEEEKKESES